jgi:hypothetical protein
MTSDFDRGPIDEETPDPADIAKWCPQLTDAESAALARKRADQEATR